jgi:hypothetical protein
VQGGVLADACGELLREFFAERRRSSAPNGLVASADDAIPTGEAIELLGRRSNPRMPMTSLTLFSPSGVVARPAGAAPGPRRLRGLGFDVPVDAARWPATSVLPATTTPAWPRCTAWRRRRRRWPWPRAAATA